MNELKQEALSDLVRALAFFCQSLGQVPQIEQQMTFTQKAALDSVIKYLARLDQMR